MHPKVLRQQPITVDLFVTLLALRRKALEEVHVEAERVLCGGDPRPLALLGAPRPVVCVQLVARGRQVHAVLRVLYDPDLDLDAHDRAVSTGPTRPLAEGSQPHSRIGRGDGHAHHFGELPMGRRPSPAPSGDASADNQGEEGGDDEWEEEGPGQSDTEVAELEAELSRLVQDMEEREGLVEELRAGSAARQERMEAITGRLDSLGERYSELMVELKGVLARDDGASGGPPCPKLGAAPQDHLGGEG